MVTTRPMLVPTYLGKKLVTSTYLCYYQLAKIIYCACLNFWQADVGTSINVVLVGKAFIKV